MLLLIGGPSYIRLNQSHLYSQRFAEKKTNDDVEKIIERMSTHLQRHHYIPLKSSIIARLSKEIRDLFDQRHVTPIVYTEQLRSRHERNLLLSIRRKLKRHSCTIRITDKSGVFHIGAIRDHEGKVNQYRLETNAYVELPSNPLEDIFKKVVQLLNELRSKKQILQWQCQKMMPDRKKVQLAYQYFNPKTHKVNFEIVKDKAIT